MKRLLLCAVAACCMVGSSSAVFADWADNFDSYASQAALDAVWTPVGAPMTLVTDRYASANQSIYQGTVAQQSYRAIGNDIATSSLYFRCSFYDSSPALGRTYAMVYSREGAVWSGVPNQILAIGKYSSFATSKYCARVAFGGINWFTLDSGPDRSVGWHTAEIMGRGDGTVDFLIDGILGGNKPVAEVGFNMVVMGSGLNNATPAWYDDVFVRTVPEPGGLLALGAGMVGLAGLVRRRK